MNCSDPALGKNLSSYDFPVIYDKNILELTRFCRFHIKKCVKIIPTTSICTSPHPLLRRLMKQFGETDIMKFQVGLGHSFSRTKIQLDPNRQDKPVQNAVALIEAVSHRTFLPFHTLHFVSFCSILFHFVSFRFILFHFLSFCFSWIR